MANLNKYLCIGRMIKDCEVTYAQSGTCICKFTLATNEKYKDVEKTEFTNLTAFGKTGETIGKYCSKGSELYTESRKETTKYQDSNGNDKWSTSFVVLNFQFIGSKSDNQNTGQQSQQQAPPQQQSGGFQQQQTGGFVNSQQSDGLPF